MANLLLNKALSTSLNLGTQFLVSLADQAITNAFDHRVLEGPRLNRFILQTSEEGAPMTRFYGRARLVGQIIWATRFKEHIREARQGGKGGGGTKLRTYRYTISFAVGLCEGEISLLGRVWANGQFLDLSRVNHRVYTGSRQQEADPLILATEGEEQAPAFRGTAYIVFEDFPLEFFGNRIPQLNFECFRSLSSKSLNPSENTPELETLVKGVNLIPGSGEFVYALVPVYEGLGPGKSRLINVNNARGMPDLEVSLERLQAHLPSCRSIVLVVCWFGTDLRAGYCRFLPGVEEINKNTWPLQWRVNGYTRSEAHLISRYKGRPALGGTPCDESIITLIKTLKSRGFSIVFHPFIVMDIPEGANLPSPYGGLQPAYPWRGRITTNLAYGQKGSSENSSAVQNEIDQFMGQCQVKDFQADPEKKTILYQGKEEGSYRRMILHYAHLVLQAGGVDAFLLGSELKGLTQIRKAPLEYPFVNALKVLAQDVRSLLGSKTKISYAADWSEYAGHFPEEGKGEICFHLDPLWSDASIDFIGLDWYIPLSDWRSGQDHKDKRPGRSLYDLAYLQGSVEGGEGFDWYYRNMADRVLQKRTPYSSYTKKHASVFRYKDLRQWWENPHYNQKNRKDSLEKTSWQPASKPFWFLETGCPAVDKGSNQPNVFLDLKSTESHLPYASNGVRDDLIQRRYLEALLEYWQPERGNNPVSPVNHKPMINTESIHVWAWDARPYPDFPARGSVWADHENWRLGHWLNGRVGLSSLALIIKDICMQAGLDFNRISCSGLEDLVSGYSLDRPVSARAALEPLETLYNFHLIERPQGLFFTKAAKDPDLEKDQSEFVQREESPLFTHRKPMKSDQVSVLRLQFIDDQQDYNIGMVTVQGADEGRGQTLDIAYPFVLDTDQAREIAENLLQKLAFTTETIQFSLPNSSLALEAGDVIRLSLEKPGFFKEKASRALFSQTASEFLESPEKETSDWKLTKIQQGEDRRIEAEKFYSSPSWIRAKGLPKLSETLPVSETPVYGVVLDLPRLPEEEGMPEGFMVGCFSTSWREDISVYAGADKTVLQERALCTRPVVMGVLNWDLWRGVLGRWDDGNQIEVQLYGGTLSSKTHTEILNGENRLAVALSSGRQGFRSGFSGENWEILQFSRAELVGENRYRLSGFLRGLFGTDQPGKSHPVPKKSPVILLDSALQRLPIYPHEWNAKTRIVFTHKNTYPTEEDSTSRLSASYGGRIFRPYRPVHIRAYHHGKDVLITWIRQTRLRGDDWEASEVPLGEAFERYRIVFFSGGTELGSHEVSRPEFLLSHEQHPALLQKARDRKLEVKICQISERYGQGAQVQAQLDTLI